MKKLKCTVKNLSQCHTVHTPWKTTPYLLDTRVGGPRAVPHTVERRTISLLLRIKPWSPAHSPVTIMPELSHSCLYGTVLTNKHHQPDIVGTVYHLVVYMQSNKMHNFFLYFEFYSSHMLDRHVSDLTGPSSGAFVYKLYVQIWYVVIHVLPHTNEIMWKIKHRLCSTPKYVK